MDHYSYDIEITYRVSVDAPDRDTALDRAAEIAGQVGSLEMGDPDFNIVSEGAVSYSEE